MFRRSEWKSVQAVTSSSRFGVGVRGLPLSLVLPGDRLTTADHKPPRLPEVQNLHLCCNQQLRDNAVWGLVRIMETDCAILL